MPGRVSRCISAWVSIVNHLTYAGLFGSLVPVRTGDAEGLSKHRGKTLKFCVGLPSSQMLSEELAQHLHPGHVHSSYVLPMAQAQGTGPILGQPHPHPDDTLSQWLGSELLTDRSIGSSHLSPEIRAFSL